MRNLKRVLSLVMMVAMLCSVMLIGANAAGYDDFTDKDEIVNKTAVETLVELGVISGKEDGSYFAPQDNLTRAEAAKLVTVVLNGGTEPVLSDPSYVSYYDTQGTWGSKYIEYVTALNIAAGDGQGYFKPDESLTATQLAKMLLVGMGYDAAFEGMVGGTWDSKTDALANQKDLYEGLPADFITSAPINRDNAALIIYNALSENLVAYQSAGQDGGVGVQAIDRDVTVLNEFFQVSEVKAVAVANDVFNLEGNTKCITNKSTYDVIEVDNVVSNMADVTLPYDLDNDVVGKSVILYVKNLGRTTASVIGSAIVSEDNTVATTSQAFKDATKLDDYLKGVNLTWDNATSAMSLNGAAAAGSTKAQVIAGASNPGVQFTFIDNDADGVVDYALKTIYTLGKIAVYNTSSEELTLQGGTAIDFSDVIGYENFARNDYVLYVQFGPTYTYLEAVETVTGTATSYNTSDKKLTVEGNAYAESALPNTSGLTDYAAGTDYIGNSYTFYLDQAGNIIAESDYVAGDRNFGLIIASNAEVSSLGNPSGQVRILKADGQEVEYNVDLAATALKYLDAGISLDYIVTGDPTDETIEVASNSATSLKEMGMALRLAYYNTDDPDMSTDGNENALPAAANNTMEGQIVVYTVNESGSIVMEPTTTKDEVEAQRVAGGTDQAVRTNSAYTVGANRVTVNNSTVFFYLNDDGTTSVITGVNNLPTTTINQATVKYIAYRSVNNVWVADAVYVEGRATSSSVYAYVVDDPSIEIVEGVNIYTYDIVYTDGTTDSIRSKDNVDGEAVYKVGSEDGYATLRQDEYTGNADTTTIMTDYVVTSVDGSSITLALAQNDATVYSKTMTSGVQVVDVQDDTPAVVDTSALSIGSRVSAILDSDGYISQIFITGFSSGWYTVDVGTSGVTVPADNTVIAEGTSVDVTTTAGAAGGDTYVLTTADPDDTEVTFRVAQGETTASFTMPAADVTIVKNP